MQLGKSIGEALAVAPQSAATVLPTSQPQVREWPLELPGWPSARSDFAWIQLVALKKYSSLLQT